MPVALSTAGSRRPDDHPLLSRRPSRRSASALATIAASCALAALARHAHADPPLPLARCAPAASPAPAGAELALVPPTANVVLSRVAAARDGDRVVIAARVLPRAARARGAATQILVGETDAAGGAWLVPPREVASLPGRVDGALALLARDGARRVLFDTERGARAVMLAATAGATDTALDLAPPTRDSAPHPVVAVGTDAFALVWPRPAGGLLQRLGLRDPSASAATAFRIPRRTHVIDAAAGPEGTTALVIETAPRRYYIGRLDGSGVFHWTGNAPAGCEHRRCPAVRLLPARDGYVAAWFDRPTRDGLRVPAGRALAASGLVRGGATAFLPMVRGAVISGPQGQPLALQLGRPVIARGGEHPVALPGTEHTSDFPAFATAWTVPGSPASRLEVLLGTRTAHVLLSALECTDAPAISPARSPSQSPDR